MPLSPLQALSQTFLPNHAKLKGVATVIAAIERNERAHFEPVFRQALVDHTPQLLATHRAPYRIGVVDLPPPRDMGDAYLIAWVAKIGEPSFARTLTLEYDYVLQNRSERTLVCERDGGRLTKHFEGPPWTGDFAIDAPAFVDALMEIFVPTKVTRR